MHFTGVPLAEQTGLSSDGLMVQAEDFVNFQKCIVWDERELKGG